LIKNRKRYKPLRKGLTANLFKKDLIENVTTFEDLIHKPYPAWSSGAKLTAQRLNLSCSGTKNEVIGLSRLKIFK